MTFRREAISLRLKAFLTYLLVIGLGLTIPAGSFLSTTERALGSIVFGAPARDKQPAPSFANPTSTVFINEILYDITGTDAGEFVEVAAPAGTNMADYSIVLYNGSGGALYDTDALSGTTTNQQGGYGFVSISYPSNGIQNGAPDGIALVNTSTSTLIQFLCYEGTFAGVGGAANGVTCTDIGVSQSGTNAAGTSLQLQGTGTTYGNFTWNATSIANTQNGVNTGQTFTGVGGPPTLSVNDVSMAEGNAGPTTFTFTASLTAAAASDVTFDIATADGTAQDGNPGGEDNDYVAKTETGRVIATGNTSATFTVTVNGDTNIEPNETFFVNVTNISASATAGDTQGQGTITTDDVTLSPIHDIQGSGTISPLSGSVTTTGIVTGTKSNGFFLQTPDANADANPATSEGIFVFTSSAPPAAAAIGNSVEVTGTIQEFIPSQDLNSPPLTELVSPTVVLLSSGNPLPASIPISAAETTQPSGTANPLDTLEEYEGMRVTVLSLTVCGPTQGSINEPNATVTSNGIFYGVITGVARPFREPGIATSDPLPPGAPATVPRFDENPERLRVDSDAQPGAILLDVAAGTVITNITGPLDFGFRTYTIDPDAATPPTVGAQPGSTAVPVATADEVTVASFNMQRFFDTINDPGGDPVLTAAAYDRRLDKASLIIRTIQQSPDVIGVQEVEHLTTLQDVAARVNSQSAGTPNYQAYLVEGNDIGGIDVGFLVKSSRVTVVDVTQVELAGCDHVTATTCNNYINPNNGQPDILNDRPPLVLRATIPRPPGGTLAFTVIVNHMRSLSGIDDPSDGNRVRTKRRAGAEFLANYIQGRQTADPAERIITVGDLNAFQVNDGYVDVIGTIKGTPAPASQVTLASSDLVNPDLVDLIDLLPAAQRYSYTFDGNAQVLDHIIVNNPAFMLINRFAYARNDSDFATKNYESTNELRISDHDQPVAYFSLTRDPTAAPANISGRIATPDGSPLGGVVVHLGGAATRVTVTDSAGSYRFDDLDTNNFYTVTPSLANYTFSPANRSFSLTGNMTDAGFTANPDATQTANAIDTVEYFVRQQYLDFLGREPDQGGLEYWSSQFNVCNGDATCIRNKRIDVSAAFFASLEFQQTGSYIYGLYAGSLGRTPGYGEFMPDRAQVVGGSGLDPAKTAFAQSFVQRSEFTNRYPQSMTREQFVDAVIQTMQVRSGMFMTQYRDGFLNDYDAGGRALVVRHAAEAGDFVAAEYNKAFVLMEYFGYLRRDIDPGGYAFWLDVLTNTAGGTNNYRGMVCAFLTSTEYQHRFSTVVTHSNAECGP